MFHLLCMARFNLSKGRVNRNLANVGPNHPSSSYPQSCGVSLWKIEFFSQIIGASWWKFFNQKISLRRVKLGNGKRPNDVRWLPTRGSQSFPAILSHQFRFFAQINLIYSQYGRQRPNLQCQKLRPWFIMCQFTYCRISFNFEWPPAALDGREEGDEFICREQRWEKWTLTTMGDGAAVYASGNFYNKKSL